MKIYFDTEFLEGTQKRNFLGLRFGKTRPMIELISIGLVSEDGMRDYYGVCNEFNLNEAWNRLDIKRSDTGVVVYEYWIRNNVLKPLFDELVQKDLKSKNPFPAKKHRFTKLNMEMLLHEYGKKRKEIASDIKQFVFDCWSEKYLDGLSILGKEKPLKKATENIVNEFARQNGPVQFCAYYSDYDWVVFCQLFGKMIDLPSGFPMYCYDLIQKFHDKVRVSPIKADFEYSGGSELTFKQKLDFYKNRPEYPKNKNEHSAIADARWNRVFDFFIDKHVK